MNLFLTISLVFATSAVNPNSLSECGVSAAFVCLREIGVNVSLNDVRTMALSLDTKPDLSQLSIAELKRVIELGGGQAVALKIAPSVSSLMSVSVPCILHLDIRRRDDRENSSDTENSVGHYVVLHSIDRKKNLAVVSDTTTRVPMIRREVPLEIVAKIATGNVLSISRKDSISWWLQATLVTLLIAVGVLMAISSWRA